jgi:hypothetical protein
VPSLAPEGGRSGGAGGASRKAGAGDDRAVEIDPLAPARRTATCSSDVISGPREPARPRLFPASQAPETAAPDLLHLPDGVRIDYAL